MTRLKQTLKIFLIAFTVFIFSNTSNAQSLEITPSYGYQFGTRADYVGGYIKFKDSDQWGVNVAYEFRTDFSFDITYIHMSSVLNIRDVVIAPTERRLSDMNVDWIMLGTTKFFTNGKLRPFFGGNMGLAFYSPSNENSGLGNFSISSTTKFAVGAKAGINYMISDRVGINFQGNLYLPVNWGGVTIGTGGVGVGVGSTTVVGGISGGLVFRLN